MTGPQSRALIIGSGALAAALVFLAAYPEKKKPARIPAPVDGQSGLLPAGYQGGEGKYRLFDKKGAPTDAPVAATVAVAPVQNSAPLPAAAAQGIPDGSYDCKIWSGSSYIGLGIIRSAGNALDTSLLAKVGATFTGAEATAEGITVSYTTARGNRESMDCARL